MLQNLSETMRKLKIEYWTSKPLEEKNAIKKMWSIYPKKTGKE